MSITSYTKFADYRTEIFSLSLPLQNTALVSEQFLLEKSKAKDLAIYYAPVEYLNEHATVLIVGITPGLQQMKKAYTAVVNNKDGYLDNEELLHRAKIASSYAGQMRKNLVQMLDSLELPKHLGISASAELFSSANHLIHTTGLLPYPVFYKGKNFTGTNPNIIKTDILRKYVVNCFVNDVASFNNPLIVPLGVNVAKALQYLTAADLLSPANILDGFPHPSGANGHRHKQFTANKERLRKKIEDYFKDRE